MKNPKNIFFRNILIPCNQSEKLYIDIVWPQELNGSLRFTPNHLNLSFFHVFHFFKSFKIFKIFKNSKFSKFTNFQIFKFSNFQKFKFSKIWNFWIFEILKLWKFWFSEFFKTFQKVKNENHKKMLIFVNLGQNGGRHSTPEVKLCLYTTSQIDWTELWYFWKNIFGFSQCLSIIDSWLIIHLIN